MEKISRIRINETPYDDEQYSVTFERASEIYDSKKNSIRHRK